MDNSDLIKPESHRERKLTKQELFVFLKIEKLLKLICDEYNLNFLAASIVLDTPHTDLFNEELYNFFRENQKKL